MSEKENLVEAVPQNDPVNHPSHYCVGGVECFPMMRKLYGDFKAGAFAQLNAFKYQWRTGHKNGHQDLKKAEWYLSIYNKELAAAEDKVKEVIAKALVLASEFGASDGTARERVRYDLCRTVTELFSLLGIQGEWDPESGTLPKGLE